MSEDLEQSVAKNNVEPLEISELPVERPELALPRVDATNCYWNYDSGTRRWLVEFNFQCVCGENHSHAIAIPPQSKDGLRYVVKSSDCETTMAVRVVRNIGGRIE